MKTFEETIEVIRFGTADFVSDQNPDQRLRGIADIVQISPEQALGNTARVVIDSIHGEIERRRQEGARPFAFDQEAITAGACAALEISYAFDSSEPLGEYLIGVSRYGSVPRRIVANIVDGEINQPKSTRDVAHAESLYEIARINRALNRDTMLFHWAGGVTRNLVTSLRSRTASR